MQPVGDVAHDHLGSFRIATGINRGEPSQALGQPVAEGVEHPVELLLDGVFARRQCGELGASARVNG